MEEVKAVFSITTPITMYYLMLYIQPSGDTILANVLGRNQVKYLVFDGNYSFPSISVDPDAFRSSKFTFNSVGLKKLPYAYALCR